MISVNHVNIHLWKLSSLYSGMLKLRGYNPIPSIPSLFGSGIAFIISHPPLFIALYCPYPIQDCISYNTKLTNYYQFTVYKVFRICNRFKFSFTNIINNIIHQLYVNLLKLEVIINGIYKIST